MKKSFKELEENIDTANIQDLKDTLEAYATNHGTIDPQVVIKLINHTAPSPDDIKILLTSGEKGFREQNRRREFKAADEYEQVVNHLRRSLRSTQ